MDSLITGLAGIVVLALPFAMWFKLAERARRKRELDDIKKLATERSEWLDKLHSRLDALDKQESEHEPMAIEEVTSTTLLVRELISAYQASTWRDIAAKRYSFIDPEALDPESQRLGTRYLHCDRIYHLLMESDASPEWVKDVDPHESTQTSDSRRKAAYFTRLEGRVAAS